MKTFLMLFIVALYFALPPPAHAGVFAYGETTTGGRINLTDVKDESCSAGLIMFEAAADGRVAWGCWYLLDEYVSIRYTDGSQLMVLAKFFKEVKHAPTAPNKGKDKGYRYSPT